MNIQEIAETLGLDPDQAQSTLQNVLQHLSSGRSAETAAASAGVDPARLQQLMPDVMGLLQARGGQEGGGFDLSGLMGSLQASPLGGLLSGLDADKEGSPAADALGAVKGLFGGKPG